MQMQIQIQMQRFQVFFLTACQGFRICAKKHDVMFFRFEMVQNERSVFFISRMPTRGNVPCFLFRECQPEVTFRVFYFAHSSLSLRSVFFISRSLTKYLPELTFRVFYFAATSSLDPDVTCFFVWACLRRAIPPFLQKNFGIFPGFSKNV